LLAEAREQEASFATELEFGLEFEQVERAVVERERALRAEQSLVNDIPNRSTILTGAFVMVLRVAGLFAAFLLIPACHRRSAPRDLSEDMPADAGQQARALAAVEGFRASFNSNACQPIYDAASPDFRSQNSEDWVRDCQRLRQQLGGWQRFRMSFAHIYGKPQVDVFVMGSAEFERQTTEVGINLVLIGDKAYLRTFSVRDGNQHWTELPPLPLPYHPRLADPPPTKSPENGIAL
jgi:hypothetical protein